ncbi:MAG TPA: response regulator transcription factor [Hyphomicrobiaceae bacterium]|jgi:DNA-binding NarL/FixJ family response regulator
MPSHRIVIVDDHPLFRGALSQAINAAFQNAQIVECGSLEELVTKLEADAETDLILLDLSMPGVRGLSGLLYLRTQHPGVPVVIVSATDDVGTIRRCIDFGASGFVPKSEPVDHIRAAVRAVLDGEIWTPPGIDLAGAADRETSDLIARLSTLTPQQVRVLLMLGEGLLNKQIAFKLGVSEATIKAHVSAILQKLGVDSRTQAVIAIGKLDPANWQKSIS